MINFIFVNIIIPFGTSADQTSRIVASSGTIINNNQVESLKVLRFEGLGTLGDQKLNASFVVEIIDMYRAGHWMTDISDDIHSLDPDLKVIVYRDFMNINSDYYLDLAVANDWILKDVDGNFVYAINFPNNLVADRASSTFMEYVADLLKSYMQNGFDGVFCDNALQLFPNDEWTMSARPVNPRTGQLYTDQEWLEDTSNFIDYIKTEVPEASLIANGMPFSGHFFYQYQTEIENYLLNSKLDGKFFEGTFNNFNGLYTEAKWKESVDMIVRFQEFYLSDPSKIIVIWSPNNAIPEGITKNQMSSYIFTSSLLGVSRSNQNYISCHDNMDSAFTQSLFDIDLGIPIEDYHIIEGTHIYEREFSKVLVLVNPTDTDIKIELGDTYLNLNGRQVSSITLKKFSGTILRPIS